MLPFRNIQPAEQPLPPTLPANHNQPDSEKGRRNHHGQAWEEQKDLITQLYFVEGKDLKATMKEVERQIGFKAGERTWKKMIKLWGLEKNIPETAYSAMSQKRARRKNEGRETEFMFRSVPVKRERIDRSERRNAKQKSQSSMDCSSPEIGTPEGVQYFTPEGNQASPAMIDCEHPTAIPSHGLDERLSGLLNRQGNAILEFGTIVQVYGSFNRYTEAAYHRDVQDHHHQMRVLEAETSGRFIEADRTRQLLRQARNLAIDLHQAMHRSEELVRRDTGPATSRSLEYFILKSEDWQLPNPDAALVITIAEHWLCQELARTPGDPLLFSCHRWRAMDEAAGLNLSKMARRIFGDMTIPYFDMGVCYFYAICTLDQRPLDCALLRITLAVDSTPEVQGCSACQVAFMALDYIDEDGSARIHIPLAHPGAERRCDQEEEFDRIFKTERTISTGTLISRAVSCKGWWYEARCRHPNPTHCDFRNEEDVWDPVADYEQGKPFQPFPPDHGLHLCFNNLRFPLEMGHVLVDEDEKWDPDGTLDRFDPNPEEPEDSLVE